MVNISNGLAIERTERRRRSLENNYGLTVLTIKTCQIEKLLKSDLEMTQFFETYQYRAPMRPREGFFGGQTSVVLIFC